MSRRKLRAAPALRAYIKRFAPKPAAPKAPPVDNPYHRFFTHNRSLEELARPNINEKQGKAPFVRELAAKRTEGESI